jgi:hypothetical protein
LDARLHFWSTVIEAERNMQRFIGNIVRLPRRMMIVGASSARGAAVLVLMALVAADEIGKELRHDADELLWVEDGQGAVIIYSI